MSHHSYAKITLMSLYKYRQRYKNGSSWWQMHYALKNFTAAYKFLKKIPNKEQKDVHYCQKCYISCKYPWEMSWARTIALTCGVATILSVKTSPSGSLPSLSNCFWVIKLSMSMPLESSRCFSLRCCDSAHSQFIELHSPTTTLLQPVACQIVTDIENLQPLTDHTGQAILHIKKTWTWALASTILQPGPKFRTQNSNTVLGMKCLYNMQLSINLTIKNKSHWYSSTTFVENTDPYPFCKFRRNFVSKASFHKSDKQTCNWSLGILKSLLSLSRNQYYLLNNLFDGR